ADHVVADYDGDRAGKRARHHGTVDGHAHPASRTHPGKDSALRADRTMGHASGAGGVASDFSHPVRGQFLAVDLGVAALHPDHPGSGTVHLYHLTHAATGQHGYLLAVSTVHDAERLHVSDP